MTRNQTVHTVWFADITFDSAKDARNIEERGLSFERVAEFDFDSAVFVEETRRDYGERRWRALGLVGDRVHALVFVETESGIRVISFRKANEREVKSYEQEAKP